MPQAGCVRQRQRRGQRPALFGNNSSLIGSPLPASLNFATACGLRRNDTLDGGASPAPLHPMVPSITGHLRRLYNDLRGPDDNFSLWKLEAFLERVQGGISTPPWTFSKGQTPSDFTFEHFQEFWWRFYSRGKRNLDPEKKDLDKPISNYFINSSHNTYIEAGDQLFGEAKDEQYKKVLGRGCRCVEIDVWNCLDTEEASQVSTREMPGTKRNQGSSHWSFSPVLSWVRARYRRTDSTTFLNPQGKSQSFRAKPLARASPISEMTNSASTASLLRREPRVCHAYRTSAGDFSLHASIPFRHVCRAIKESAFTVRNQLPVIISLEVHATGLQQEVMVDIMKEEWGDLLLDEALPDCDPEKRQPTLRELKGKILLKIKRGLQADVVNVNNDTIRPAYGTTFHTTDPPESGFTQNGGGDVSDSTPCYRMKRQEDAHKVKLRPPLEKLAIYTYSPGPFESFDTPDAGKPAHIFSFGEEKLKDLHQTKHDDVFKHNKRHLARTFPEGLWSLLSSNPNYPTLFWRKGVQMVALNWQNWDTAMELNDAMFDHENGWVLKTPGYQSGTTAECQADVPGKKILDLSITVLAGQHVPAPAESEVMTTRPNFAAVNHEDFRPRVKCFLHVESSPERNRKKAISRDEICRKTRPSRTEHPDWGSTGAKLSFPTVGHVVEELSFVRLQVEHCGRGRCQRTAWACIRLDRLQQGYRFIKLKTGDGYGGRNDGLLLVKIEKRVSDEPRRLSLRSKTWNACKKEVSQLGSRWSCMK